MTSSHAVQIAVLSCSTSAEQDIRGAPSECLRGQRDAFGRGASVTGHAAREVFSYVSKEALIIDFFRDHVPGSSVTEGSGGWDGNVAKG